MGRGKTLSKSRGFFSLFFGLKFGLLLFFRVSLRDCYLLGFHIKPNICACRGDYRAESQQSVHARNKTKTYFFNNAKMELVIRSDDD